MKFHCGALYDLGLCTTTGFLFEPPIPDLKVLLSGTFEKQPRRINQGPLIDQSIALEGSSEAANHTNCQGYIDRRCMSGSLRAIHNTHTIMTPAANLSPRSVLNFVDDELPMEVSACNARGKKRKLCLSFDADDQETQNDVLQAKRSCRAMNFRHRLVCDQTVEWLAAGERNLEKLWLGPVFESSATVLAAIETLPVSVTHLDLDLRNALHLLPEVMPLLFHKSHLVSLSIRLFGDSGAVELSKCIHLNPNLKRLNLRDNRIGNEGVRAIGRAISSCNLSLEHLDLSCNCIMDTDPIRELLETTTSLNSLDISFNWIGDGDIERICDGLRTNTSLNRLNILGCQRITQGGLSSLSKCLEDHNASLHHIHFQTFATAGTRLSSQLRHWLSLNRAGRSLLRSENAEQSPLWPLLLAKSSVEPTTLYHILQQGGPQLFGR
jgi:hypothetical protein